MRWFAYASNESGRFEVYVQPFALLDSASVAGKWQISREGGTRPKWRSDAKEIIGNAAHVVSAGLVCQRRLYSLLHAKCRPLESSVPNHHRTVADRQQLRFHGQQYAGPRHRGVPWQLGAGLPTSRERTCRGWSSSA